jgi:hypothetical protein
MFAICLFIVIFFLFAAYKLKFSERDTAFASLPSPSKFFTFKNAVDFLRMDIFDFVFQKIQNYHRELGEVFLLNLHPFDCGLVVIADVDVAEKVSFHQPDRMRCFAYHTVAKLMGEGLFLSSQKMCNEVHYRHFKQYMLNRSFEDEVRDREHTVSDLSLMNMFSTRSSCIHQ